MKQSILAAQSPAIQPDTACHRLQLYTADGEVLVSNVCDYLCEGLERGEGILIVTTPEHRAAFERKMMARISRADFARGLETRQIVFQDAQDLLSLLVVGGKLEWARFECIVGSAISQVRPRNEGFPCRAYGEMVGLLWTAGEFAAAARLEEFWNTLLRGGGFQLFCAYPIDVFAAEFHSPAVRAVLQCHTHLISCGDDALHAAVNRAAGEVFQSRQEMPKIGPLRADVPEAEAKILWLRENHAGDADQILSRARQHYDSEKRFRALVENSSDAIALVDPQGVILYASPPTARILGYQSADIKGRNAIGFIHRADRGNVSRTIGGVLKTPRVPIRVELRVRRRNGSWCWIEATGSNLLDEPDIAAIVFNYRDISERKAAEMALRESEAALRHANAGLEQFAYAAAHDLQEPIRNVAIYVELLARNYKDKLDAEANELIKVAADGALRMQTLTRDLLAFTRSLDDPAHSEPAASNLFADSNPAADSNPVVGSNPVVDSNKVFTDVVANLKETIESSEATITRDDLPALPIHRTHLLQVLQNLVCNALKYRSAQPPQVHVSASPGKDEWLVSVADNGIGIPEEYHERIFGIFKRLHGRDVPGNGIGLAICSRIVTHYRGRIWVEQGPCGGSIFSFTLPRENTHEPN
jgi:PAS domain S-box-containing protein